MPYELFAKASNSGWRPANRTNSEISANEQVAQQITQPMATSAPQRRVRSTFAEIALASALPTIRKTAIIASVHHGQARASAPVFETRPLLRPNAPTAAPRKKYAPYCSVRHFCIQIGPMRHQS